MLTDRAQRLGVLIPVAVEVSPSWPLGSFVAPTGIVAAGVVVVGPRTAAEAVGGIIPKLQLPSGKVRLTLRVRTPGGMALQPEKEYPGKP